MSRLRALLPLTWLVLAVVALVAWVALTPPLRIVVRHLLPLGLGLGIVLAQVGVGLNLARRFFRSANPVEEFVVALALGMGLTATTVFLGGLLGVMDARIYLAMTIAGLALALLPLLAWVRTSSLPTAIRTIDGVLLAIALLFVVLALPSVVAPEISKDALEYHLLIPRLYLDQGVIRHLPRLVESCYPVMAELLYLPILAMFDDLGPTVCKSYHFWVAMAVLVLCRQLIRLVRPEGPGLLGPVLLLTMPVFAIHMAWAWNDFIFTLLVGVMVLALLRRRLAADDELFSTSHLVLAGLAGGMASWVKYTFALPFVAVSLLFVYAMRYWRWRWVEVGCFYLAFAFVAVLWLGKNYAFTGNPVYPFLNESVFHSPLWPASQAAYIQRALHDYSFTWDAVAYLTFPFRLALTPHFIELQTGIVPLLLIPLAFVPLRRPGMDLLKLFLAGYGATWVVVHLELRSLLSWFLILSVVGAVIIEDRATVWFNSHRRRELAMLLVAATLGCLAMTTVAVRHLTDPFPWFIGRESTADYLKRQAPHQVLYAHLNDAPEVGRVLLVGPREGFYLRHPALFSSFADMPIAQVLARTATGPADLAGKLRGEGVTHIVLDRVRMELDEREQLYTWSKEERQRFMRFLDEECRVTLQAGDDRLLELTGGGELADEK